MLELHKPLWKKKKTRKRYTNLNESYYGEKWEFYSGAREEQLVLQRCY